MEVTMSTYAASQPHSSSTSYHASSPASSSDRALLDMLSTLPAPGQAPVSHRHTSFGSPSSQHAPLAHANGKRPLATLAALRRPPIDPIILAASLSSGPHVTRHHFHHSYGAPRQSKQMTVSQRTAKQRDARTPSTTYTSTARRDKPRTDSVSGSYANCDLNDEALASLEVDALKAESEIAELVNGTSLVPAVTEEEKLYYASKQAPRSERLHREAAAASKGRPRDVVEKSRSSAHPAAPLPPAAAESQILSGPSSEALKAESDARRPSLTASPSGKSQPSKAATQLSEALHSRQQLISSAPSTPLHLSSLPSGGPQLGMPAGQTTPMSLAGLSSIVRPPPLHVRCYARTRIPTPHGEAFCHLYRNNHDGKEHLALVIDTAQNSDQTMAQIAGGSTGENVAGAPPHLRSRTLDEVWSSEETEMERIVRGAYVGRLGPSFQQASIGRDARSRRSTAVPAHRTEEEEAIAPLVRIHSECYTGETIGSQRCDCGEQLDEAIRLIHASGTLERPARGVIVYLRQEGRGIGLLDKLMAYNLQDMGHDTVSANVLLGHLPDARKYDIAAAILRDLGIADCRLLTNNPDKMEALEREGVRVSERVAMIPRAWRQEIGARHRRRKAAKRRENSTRSKAARKKATSVPMDASVLSQAPVESNKNSPRIDTEVHSNSDSTRDSEWDEESDDGLEEEYVDHVLRRSGATMLGASVTRGPELEKYLRTKVERMGHMLDLPPDVEHAATASAPSGHPLAESARPGGEGEVDEEDIVEVKTDPESLLDEKDLQHALTETRPQVVDRAAPDGQHADGEDAAQEDDAEEGETVLVKRK